MARCYSYSGASVGRLLDRTGAFERRGQLRFVLQPAAAGLLEERARRAFGYSEPQPAVRRMLLALLHVHAGISRCVTITRDPSLLQDLKTRSCGRGDIVVERLGAHIEVPGRVSSPRVPAQPH